MREVDWVTVSHLVDKSVSEPETITQSVSQLISSNSQSVSD